MRQNQALRKQCGGLATLRGAFSASGDDASGGASDAAASPNAGDASAGANVCAIAGASGHDGASAPVRA